MPLSACRSRTCIDTDFDGFIGMVDDMGGVTVDVPYRMQDSFSGADFQPGVQTAERPPGTRRTRATGTSSRTATSPGPRTRATSSSRRSPSSAPPNTGPIGTLDLLADLGRHAKLDGIGLKDLYGLGRLGLSIDPAQVKNVLVPVVSGSGSNLALGPGAASLFADFRDDGVLQTH